MPATHVVFYKDDDGSTPLLVWLDELQPQEAVAKCIVLIEALRASGHELRRPSADILEDGIYELRARLNKVRLRMLYFFDKKTAVVTHGFVKNVARVPPAEISRAQRFRERYLSGPADHTSEG